VTGEERVLGDESQERPVLEEGQALEFRIDDVGSSGEGVGRADGKVCFVNRAVPGDLVRARVERDRGRYATAEMIELVEPSPDRVTPACAHQPECGGCPLMVLDARRSLELKVRHLEQVLRRIGRVDLRVERAIASPRQLQYRGRVRFAVGSLPGVARIGYRARRDPEALIAVSSCEIGPPGAADLARELLRALPGGSGTLWPREIEVRASRSSGERMLVVHGPAGAWPGLQRAAHDLVRARTELAGVFRTVHAGGKRQRPALLAGRENMAERVAGIEVGLGASGFVQTNPGAAELVYGVASEYLDAGTDDRLLDLYCGAGLLGLVASGRGASLVGIDADRENVTRARSAARRAGRRDARFICADAARAAEMPGRGERFSLVSANPPRAGLSRAVARAIGRLGADVVVLVSCDAATLARDLRRLEEGGLSAERVTAVDMFPHTAHLETVVRLERR
jgi:23S rRNA (uracil1939-C5)-methyltransferase